MLLFCGCHDTRFIKSQIYLLTAFLANFNQNVSPGNEQ